MYLFWEADNSLQKTGIETLNSRVFSCDQGQLCSHTEKLLQQNCMYARCHTSMEIRE
jgi:hypothetical protein